MIRLRKAERDSIVAALEGEYDSPEGAAQALFSLCFDLLSQRALVGLYVNWGSGVVFGPFADQRAAKAAGKLAASTFSAEVSDGAVRVIPLASPASLSGPPTGPDGTTSVCACGHAWGGHMNRQWKQWKKGVKDWSKQPWRMPGCMACQCKLTSEKEAA